MHFLYLVMGLWVITVSILEIQSDALPSKDDNTQRKLQSGNVGFHRGRKRIFDIILEANRLTSTKTTASFRKQRKREDLFQGDIVITESIRRAIEKSKTDYIILPGRTRVPRAASAVADHRWPIVDGVREIPYVIEPSSVPDVSMIKQAMVHWMKNVPCIKFVTRTSQADYISFFAGDGCFSWTGRRGGKQRISIGEGCTARMGVIAHEIGHALGFWHEQSRSDRDDYVKILWDNIELDRENDFKKIFNGGTNDLGIPYDYNSLMHYGPTAFAKREGLNTIVKRVDGSTDFGNADGLSPKDILQTRRMYCPGTNACSSLYTDKDLENCPKWVDFCDEIEYKKYMYENCRKSCFCRACKDNLDQCKAYVDGGYCTNPLYQGIVRRNCRKGCKVCS